MISLKVIARLLDYPDAELWENRQALLAALDGAMELSLRDSHRLMRFIEHFWRADLLDRQEEYGALFDRGRATSLLLFEHVYGESRDRGQAMVDLLAQYRKSGLDLDCKELPDYLPLYLEYLSQLDDARGRAGLLDIAPILALLRARLQQRDSRYGELLDLLLSLSGDEPADDNVRRRVRDEARDDTPQALDAVWEEEQVKFLGEQGCASAQQTAHRRRFANAVAPQYLHLDEQTAGGKNDELH
ncbi:nitrate reductase molybdenum cofactor assembly chaperone [Brenneria populi subsp. brevivirga]|uniref:nitrate reductase molybdenum cofactor assembly chaperone n=1 Tax=Brenneria populi TaxID=1505588 RepID=UPI002E18BF59|nr:nitrate reductase molybdenum cofactor assembly chaperone [Brenneria populi subsp. brevivirga]